MPISIKKESPNAIRFDFKKLSLTTHERIERIVSFHLFLQFLFSNNQREKEKYLPLLHPRIPPCVRSTRFTTNTLRFIIFKKRLSDQRIISFVPFRSREFFPTNWIEEKARARKGEEKRKGRNTIPVKIHRAAWLRNPASCVCTILITKGNAGLVEATAELARVVVRG